MKITKKYFDKTPAGKAVYEFTVTNSSGASVSFLTLGGAIRKLFVPDAEGKMRDIVCGFDNAKDYFTSTGYQGMIIGRVCNRISGARFTLDGKTYKLHVNSGKRDCLHGGKEGFSHKVFVPVTFENELGAGVKLYLISPDGEENFPGRVDLCVTYTFTEENRLIINYKAQTDKPTVLNLTNHAYFNLSGYDSGASVMENELYINSDQYLPCDEDLIPLPCGYQPVKGTDYDYTQLRKVRVPLDLNFLLRDFNGMVKRAAFLCDRTSGISLTVYTNAPAIQMYTGCVMNGPELYKGGVKQVPLRAICLETSFPNDAPNRPDFIPCVLRPEELLDSTTVFEFGVV
ncbi:MAG: galactose mutarotase [Clostridia bacterium]|nr:galactose mutarotase [Clostridia bacterium]